MAKITYKSSIPNDKPLWLLKLQLAVSQLDATGLKGNEQDFRNLKSFIDAEIRSLMGKGDIRRSFVEKRQALWKPNYGRMKTGQ